MPRSAPKLTTEALSHLRGLLGRLTPSVAAAGRNPGRRSQGRTRPYHVPVNLARHLAAPFLGRRRLQPVYERMYRLAVAGMNMGPAADDPRSSGEVHVLRMLPAEATILDVGANVGVYSALALATVPSARILAFEPGHEAQKHYRAAISDRAQLLGYGLGDVDGDLELFTSPLDLGLASTIHRHHDRVTWQPSGSVSIRRLDSVATELGLDRIDLLKIDVEGGELAVLRGARGLLEGGRIGRVQFEFGGTAIDGRIYLRDLVAELPGFELYRILRDGLIRVTYSELWEVFTTTNYLAVRSA